MQPDTITDILQTTSIMKIAGDGFILREWRDEDMASLSRHADNINVWNNLRDQFPHPYTEDDARAFFEVVKSRPYQMEFIIEVDGQAAGNMGFVPGVDVERFSAEIGYFTGEEFWGRGIMSKAVRLLVEEYIFTQTPIVRVFTAVFDFNIGSQRVLEKAGFRRLATLHKAAYKNGRFIDEIAFERVKE